MVQPGTPQMSI